MNKAKLTRIVKTWQKRLKLQHIKLVIEFGQPEQPDAIASVEPSELYDVAFVKFGPGCVEEDDFALNRIVVHELLHVLFRDYTNAVGLINEAGILSHQVEVMWHESMRVAEEGLVDRLAHRLVELGGVVE